MHVPNISFAGIRTSRWGGAVVLLVSVAAHSGAAAQEPTDSLRAEVARLAALVDSLSREVARLLETGREAEADHALARLRAAAASAAAAGGQPTPAAAAEGQEFVGRQRSLQLLNPEISVNTDGFAHVNKDAVDEDNFFMRVFELAIISNLDPFSGAKIFIVRDQEGGEIAPFESAGAEEEEGASFVVEEGYVEWVGLASGLGLKFGRFFHQFGQLNRWHQHALPLQSRSLPHIAFLGKEPLGGTGASVHWLLPIGVGSGTYEATWEMARKENENLFGEASGVSILGHLNAFWNLSSATDLDLGLSWIRGSYLDDDNAGDRDLYGAEMALTWRPPERSRDRGFTFRGGVMALSGLVSGVTPVPGPGRSALTDERALGWWISGELRLSQRWLVGGRFDRGENPENTSETAWVMSPTLTWWQSEYVRLRLEYDLLGRSFVTTNEGRLFFQVTFAMGPHKHETY